MKKIYLLATAALMLVACDKNDDTPESSQVAAKITATIGESVSSTRAKDSSWEVNDKIGISSSVGGVDGPYFNIKYTLKSTDKNGYGEFTGTDLFFYKPMTLTAYYPFTGEEGTAPGDKGIIKATTDADAQKDLPSIDFLWASQTGFTVDNREVNFEFAHKMSKISLTFRSSDPMEVDGIKIDGVNVGTMISYNIAGLGIEGTFNTATGVCAIDESKRDGLEITFSKDESAEKIPERKFSPVIVFPQSLVGSSVKLHIYTDELNNPDLKQHYECNLSFSDGEIKAGYHYRYTIQVSKVGLIVGKMSVEPWNEQDDRFLTATIDSDSDPFKEKN